MANEEVVIVQPDICLDTGAAGVEGGEERLLAPVIIVGMASDRTDVCRYVGGPVAQVV